jgi:CheY-like chemotaxis protein
MNTLLEPPVHTLIDVQVQQPGSANVLYVDTDATLRRLSTLTLTRGADVVTAAEDGLQADEALHSKTYDLLITNNEQRTFSAEIAEALRHITPYPHWGLNE